VGASWAGSGADLDGVRHGGVVVSETDGENDECKSGLRTSGFEDFSAPQRIQSSPRDGSLLVLVFEL
jgi:hypothetical protein